MPPSAALPNPLRAKISSAASRSSSRVRSTRRSRVQRSATRSSCRTADNDRSSQTPPDRGGSRHSVDSNIHQCILNTPMYIASSILGEEECFDDVEGVFRPVFLRLLQQPVPDVQANAGGGTGLLQRAV